MSNVILKKENSIVKTKNEAILLYCIMKKIACIQLGCR